MKAKELAELLLLNPEMEVVVGVYTYESLDDSGGAFEFSEVNVVSRRKTTKFNKEALVLTDSKIGYPDDEKDFEVIS